MSDEFPLSHEAVETMRRLTGSNQRLAIINICLTVAVLLLAAMIFRVLFQR